MTILAIETSTPTGSVALTDGPTCCHEVHWEGNEGHTAQLMPAIEKIFRESGVDPQSLAGIAVAIGPGSFTGLRVGLATAKGLALGWGKPMVAVSSLAAMACHAATTEGLIVPMFDARRGEIYTAAYRRDGECVIAEQVITPVRWVELLMNANERCLCLGDGYLRYQSLFADGLGDPLALPSVAMHRPRAALVGQLGTERLARGEIADIATLLPHYVRRPQAEEKRGS